MSGKCQGKTKFSPGQGKLGEVWPFDPCQGIVREFCHIMSENCQGIFVMTFVFRLSKFPSYKNRSTWVVFM